MKAKITKNESLVAIYAVIKDCDTSAATTIAERSNLSYDNLKSGIDTVIDDFGIGDTWDDDIELELNGTAKTGIDDMILSCKSPADQIIISAGTNLAKLITLLKSYDEKVDEHNRTVDEYNKLGDCPEEYIYDKETGEEHYNSNYTIWVNDESRLSGILNTLNEEIISYETSSNEAINLLKNLLTPIGSETSIGALATSVGTTDTYEGKRDLSYFGYDEQYSIRGTTVKDANGNIIKETYYILSPTGEVVQTGVITYDENGSPNISQYIKKYEEPTTVEEIEIAKTAAIERGEIQEVAYLDQEVKPKEEKSSTDYDVGPDGKGKSTREYEETYEDGASVEGSETRTGEFGTDGEHLNGEVVDEGIITTSVGEQFDFENKGIIENGRVEREELIVTQEGAPLLTRTTDHVADYRNSWSGLDVGVDYVESDNSSEITLTQRVVMDDGSGNQVEQIITITRNKDDPSCGSVTKEDGTMIEVYRDENGDLYQRETYTDKHNEVVEFDTSPVEEDYASFVVNGESTTVNMDNPLDMEQVSLAYQNARIEAGFDVSYALEGQHHLMLNGEVTISSFGSENETVMQLIPLE